MIRFKQFHKEAIDNKVIDNKANARDTLLIHKVQGDVIHKRNSSKCENCEKIVTRKQNYAN